MRLLFGWFALSVLIAITDSVSKEIAAIGDAFEGSEKYGEVTGLDLPDNGTTTDDLDYEEKGTTAAPLQAATEEEDAESDFCAPPPAVERAKVTGKLPETFAVGTRIQYSCEFGYITEGIQQFIECSQRDNKKSPGWTDMLIKCTPRSCGDPGFVQNAQRDGSVFSFPHSVAFLCEEGFRLRGPDKRYCLASGTWSGSLPTCERVFCNTPSNIENGKAVYSSLEFGAELKYECERGYLIKNKESRYCSSDGKWSGKRPKCQEAKCDAPHAPVDGTVEIVGGEPRIGSLALFKCNEMKKLVGSAKSKCLDIGEWTFPPPKCVNPCMVPIMQHGKIGKYEISTYRRRRTFVKLAEGTAIEGYNDLVLMCESHYEPLGRPSDEESIKCSNGEWEETPRCEPASCREHPPVTENANIATVNRNHGGGVIYQCKEFFAKAKYGNVTCTFGTWKGERPVCEDTRCDREVISFSGLLPGRKRYYLHGESFLPSCDKGYNLADPERRINCNRRQWEGKFPPCIAANCLIDPPSIDHGFVKEYGEFHSSIATYDCNAGYFLIGSTTVQCLLGEWKGSTPRCISDGCSISDLANNKGVVPKDSGPTFSGNELQFDCDDGFYQLGLTPVCAKGKWERNEQSPCSEKNCRIASLDNGWLTIKEIKRSRVWWPNTGYAINIKYHKEKVGTRKLPKEEVYVACDESYTFHGKGSNLVKVVCERGTWTPQPICLKTGSKFEETTFVPQRSTLATTLPPPPPPPANLPASGNQEEIKYVHGKSSRTEAPLVEKEPDSLFILPVEQENPLCFCTYLSPYTNLVAYAGRELLQNGSKVKKGCKVRFHCKEFGYDRLQGPLEFECQDCQQWHSAAYPMCVRPSQSDAIIEFPEGTNIMAGGRLELKPGQDFALICHAHLVQQYPTWTYRLAGDVIISYAEQKVENEQVILTSIIHLSNTNPDQNGNYSCSLPYFRPNTVQIHVTAPIVQCPVLALSDSLNATYEDKDRKADSRVLFRCKRLDRMLVGSQVITCLANGQWSERIPRCVVTCPPLPEGDGLLVSLSNSIALDSVAGFHCFPPRVRNGSSFAKCGPSGQWSQPKPTCDLPHCTLESLFEKVPENVVPVMDDIKSESIEYNSTVRLQCDGDMRLVGTTTAKCIGENQWEEAERRCVPGCPPIEKPDSHLIVDPEKEFYRFGEFATLSCPPGKRLGSEVVRLLCLTDGWSEKEIATCQDLEQE